MAELLRDLDSETFEVRERAEKQLEQAGAAAEAVLRQALEGKPSAETRRRVSGLLEKLGGETLRRGRALEVLEWLGEEKALRDLAGGAPGASLTDEAQASLKRLSRRGPPGDGVRDPH
jgi:hypothetical protein